jgi:N-acetylneuraminic acid mutarotase
MPEEMSYLSVVAVGSAMYVLGNGVEDGLLIKFDSMQGTSSEVAFAPRAVFASAAVAVGADIYFFGGEDDDDNKLDDVYKYDTLANVWSALAPMPYASSCHSASVCNGLVYIVGAGDDSEDVVSFDPASNEWNMLGPAPSSNTYLAIFVLGGCMHMAGGIENGASVEQYDAATDTWTAVADMLRRRYAFCAVAIGSAGPAEERDFFDSLIDDVSKK